MLSRPLLGCRESGVYAGKIEARVKGNDLRGVHFTRGLIDPKEQRHTGAIRTLGKGLPTGGLE